VQSRCFTSHAELYVQVIFILAEQFHATLLRLTRACFGSTIHSADSATESPIRPTADFDGDRTSYHAAEKWRFTMRAIVSVLALGLLSCVSTLAPAQGPSAVFTSFDFPDAIGTEPTSISPDGQVVGVYVSSDGHQHGFLLNNGKFQSINFPGSTQTAARWINPRGQIVGEYTDSGGKAHGYLFSKGHFTSFDYPGAQGTVAFGIGATGDIVGPWAPVGPFTFHGFLLSQGSFSTFDFPGAMWTLPTMIVGQRTVGGYFDNTFNAHGFLLNHGDFQEIACPGYTNVFLSGLNPLGDMTGGFNSSDGVQHGLLVTDGTCTSIDFPGATSTYANSENPEGTIVGRYTSPDGKDHGYLLTGVK
jgi:hypothetical protein